MSPKAPPVLNETAKYRTTRASVRECRIPWCTSHETPPHPDYTLDADGWYAEEFSVAARRHVRYLGTFKLSVYEEWSDGTHLVELPVVDPAKAFVTFGACGPYDMRRASRDLGKAIALAADTYADNKTAAAKLHLDDGLFGTHLEAEATTQPTAVEGGMPA